jgi:hypothetical protein
VESFVEVKASQPHSQPTCSIALSELQFALTRDNYALLYVSCAIDK